MARLKSELWMNEKGKRFVVLPEADFLRMSELIEDRGLSRIFREAIESDTSEPSVPFAEVKRQLAAQRRAKAGRQKAEDAVALRALVKARKANAGKATYTLEEVKRELGMSRSGRKRKA
jgi:hypothetical protein